MQPPGSATVGLSSDSSTTCASGPPGACRATGEGNVVSDTDGHAEAKATRPGQPEWVLLYSARSAFQAISVWHSVDEDSRYLLLDNDVQLTSKGEYSYHEMMAFVPLATALCASIATGEELTDGQAVGLRIFVFGAGDAGVILRLLQDTSVAYVLQVEIDELVLNVSRRFFPELQPERGPRFDVVVGDGVDFARRAARGNLAGTFDIALLDTTDMLVGDTAPSRELFTPSLYEDLARVLRPGGILVQNVQSLDAAPQVNQLHDIMSLSFSTIVPFSIATQDYISPYIAFIASTDHLHCPQRRECARKLNMTGQRLRFYSPAIHEAAFALPAALAHLSEPLEACMAGDA